MKTAPSAAAACLLSLLGAPPLFGPHARAQQAPAGPAAPQTARPAAPAKEKLDVQILVAPLPTGEWAVAAVYPGKVAKADAVRRVHRLIGLTKWKPSGETFESRALESGPFGKPSAVMSSMSFQTRAGVVDVADGTVALEPILLAYRDLSRLHVTFLTPFPFTYRGPRAHADAALELSVRAGEGATTFVANIKNHSVERFGLPRYQAQSPVAPVAAPRPASGGVGRFAALAGVVLAALAASVAVFLGVRRWQQRT